ncbi:hypothetical protein J6590_010285 [Homalodisca vitripennis]|nr:hypothetical protein J6590_010285 [Homalodisca vitripennis]
MLASSVRSHAETNRRVCLRRQLDHTPRRYLCAVAHPRYGYGRIGGYATSGGTTTVGEYCASLERVSPPMRNPVL